MHAYRRILKGASLVSASEMVTQSCSFARNIILARFLTKAEFGVAAMLGMILTLFEMSGKMALGQQVVQSRHGDEPDFVSSVHFTQFAAGTLSGLLILIFSKPLIHLFSGPQYLASVMMLALIPFVTSLNNLDVYHRTRRLSFGPLVLTDVVPQVITTLAAWPLAALFRDYRAVLYLLLGKAFLNASMTHLLAERAYSLRFNSYWLRESLKFGWPLLLSGFVQFGNFQGDSMVVGATYTMSQLGVYSVAMTMAMAPGLTLTRIGASVGLPWLAEVQGEVPRFIGRYRLFAQTMALIGCVTMLGMLFCGEQVVVLLFGEKYAGIGALACWLMAAQSLRILRGVAVIAAMARGDTLNNLLSSSCRLSGLLLAIGVGVLKGSLTWFAVTAIVGEVIALVITVSHLSSKHSIAPGATCLPGGLGVVCVVVAGITKRLLSVGTHSFLNWLLLPIAVVLTLIVFTSSLAELRYALVSLVFSVNARLGWPVLKGRLISRAATGGGYGLELLADDKDSP
jgi:O-antigen/teichoic acid export membrane protein